MRVKLPDLICFVIAVVSLSDGQVRPYFGVAGGVATVSADAGSRLSANSLNLSSYAPENGPAMNFFVGLPVQEYVNLQLNYICNSNDLQLNSNSSNSSTFYQQERASVQRAAVLDALIYFRGRSRIRPYLGTGGGVAWLSSRQRRVISASRNAVPPPAEFSDIGPVLRVHVGIDAWLTGRLALRYSFSDTIGQNAISKHLAPPGSRGMENFQNLFGFLVRF